MSLTNTAIKANYTGNGTTTSFATGFYFLENSDVSVLVIAPGATTPTTLNQGTDYIVSGAGISSGGTVVCAVAPISGAAVTVLRTTPLTQATTFVPNDNLPNTAFEVGLDKLTMIGQELNSAGGALSRSIQFPPTEPITSNSQLPITSVRASGFLAFDVNGQIYIAQGVGAPRGLYVSGAAYNAHDVIRDSSWNVYQASQNYTAVNIATDVSAGNLVLILNAVAIAAGIAGSVTPIAPWGTGIAYAVGNIVYYTNNDIYRCATAHTSGTFATDLAAGKWINLAPSTSVGTFGVDSGASNAYVVSTSPAPAALAAGLQAQFTTANANTGASTLNFCGFGAKSIVKRGSTALQSGDIPASAMISVQYDGTNWQLLNIPSLQPVNNLSDLASASTSRSNLGLGTAATQTVGTSAGNVVQLNGFAQLPAVDGSQLLNLPGTSLNVVVLTSSGNWTVPAGVTQAKATLIGGGGGGGARTGSANTGGTTSIGSFSAAGGTGGSGSGAGTGGGASGGLVNVPGQLGITPASGGSTFGASSPFGLGSGGALGAAGSGYGAGGGGAALQGGGGGSGGGVMGMLTGLTPASNVAYTIGSGGSGGTSAGAGAPGVIVIEY